MACGLDPVTSTVRRCYHKDARCSSATASRIPSSSIHHSVKFTCGPPADCASDCGPRVEKHWAVCARQEGKRELAAKGESCVRWVRWLPAAADPSGRPLRWLLAAAPPPPSPPLLALAANRIILVSRHVVPTGRDFMHHTATPSINAILLPPRPVGGSGRLPLHSATF